MDLANADTAQVNTMQAFPELLSLPPIAVENILRSASFHGAIAACSSRALRDAWRRLLGSNPEFAATALVDRFRTVDAVAEHLYGPDTVVLGDCLVKSNIAPPAPGLLDAVASPLLSILSELLRKTPSVPALGYLAATGASDAYALSLLRRLLSLREGARREANRATVSPAINHGVGENANEDGTVAGQEQAARTVKPLPSSLFTGAAFAGHEATVVELLRYGADPVFTMLPAAVRAGNARLCAALLEGGRMAGAAYDLSTAATSSVFSVDGGPSGFLDSYASSEQANLHVASIYLWLLPLTYIGGGGGRGVGSRGSSARGSTMTSNGDGSHVCTRRVSAREILRRAVGGWCSGGAGPVQPDEDVAAALAAARAAAQEAADTALSSSNPLLVQFSAASAAAAAAAATAAALAALTPPEDPCDDSSSSSSSSSSSGGSGDVGGSSRAQIPVKACASFSSTTKHAAVRQLLLQWTPAAGQAPLPNIRAAALPYAAAVGAWLVVSEVLRAGADPRDSRAPATLLYLALVQGRGAMAAWLLARLLGDPINFWKTIVGVAFAALVTRVMGIASPLQLLLRYQAPSFFEDMLIGIGQVLVHVLHNTFIPMTFLPKHMYMLWALYGVWAALPKWRR